MQKILATLLLAVSGVQAQDAPAIDKAIYGNIISAFTLRQEAVVLLDPSLTLPWLPSNAGTLEPALQKLADTLPEPQWIYTPKRDSLRDILSFIAANAHFMKSAADDPSGDGLTPTEAQVLFEGGDRSRPKDGYKQYLDLTRRIAADSGAAKTESDSGKRSALQLESSRLSLQLSSLQQYEDIRSAARKLSTARPRSAASARLKLQNVLTAYRGPQFVPKIDKWADASGWVRIDAVLNENFDAPIFAAGPTGLSGDWWSPADAQSLLGKKVSRISFEVKRVLIDRSDLDLSFFDLRSWKMDDGTLISDGQSLTAGHAMNGRMPLLATGILLCRNISITTPSSGDAQSAILSDSGKNGFRFGSFLMGGSYSVTTAKSRFYPALGVRTISSPEIQVIALLCNQLPLSPNPDPNLKW